MTQIDLIKELAAEGRALKETTNEITEETSNDGTGIDLHTGLC